MAKNPEVLRDRGRSLEEQFFSRQSEELKRSMRQKEERTQTTERLADVSGISDRELLGKLVEAGISPQTWAAVALVPLVEVAWANGRVDEKERRAVLAAAAASGIAPSSPACQMLEAWLDRRPDAGLLKAWGEYIVELHARLDPAQKHALHDHVMGQARNVARATGGFLGLGPKISAEEEAVLTELAKAFERTPE